MNKKVIVTAALTGVLADREQCPHIPYSPKEIAEEAQRAYEAGAAIVHIHARTPEGKACWKKETFQEIADLTRKKCPVILNFSTGGIGNTIEERAANLPHTKPEMAALNMGSMNYAIYSKTKKKFYHSLVFANPFQEIQKLLLLLHECGITPEMECFDAGHVGNIRPFIDLGLLAPPYHFSFVMGVLGGIELTQESLRFMVSLLPENSHWQLIGIGKKQWEYIPHVLRLGGNVRVGLEDNFYLPNGEMAKSNGELVAAACQMIQQEGLSPMSVEEVRATLK